MNVPITSLHVAKSIVASAITESKIIIIDNAPTIFSYTHDGNYERHSTFKGFKSYIHRYTAAVTISKNGIYTLICDASNERVFLFNIQKNAIVSQIQYTKNPEYARFNDDASLFVLINETGRVSIYETFSCSILAQIQLSDAVCGMTFSSDATLLALATLDKKVHIFNMDKKSVQSSFEVGEIIEELSFSNDTSTLLLFTRQGNVQNLKHLFNQITLVDPLSEWPSTIAYSDNKEISLIGTRSNQLFIYANNHGTNLGSISFDYWGITTISLLGSKIFLGFSDANGIILNIEPSIQDAMQALEAKNYALLCTIALESPLIFTSQLLGDALKERYLDIFLFTAITYEERQGHNALSSYILASTHNRQEMMQSLYASKELLPFMEQINNGQITQACSSAYHEPILRQLREFNDIKSTCLQELKLELKLLESNPKKFQEHIESMPIKCTECIQGIIPDPKVMEEAYKQLLSSANAKNFPAVMDIVKKYPLLRQSLVYRKLMQNGEAIIDKTLIMIAAGKIAEAERYATMLTRMKPFASTGADFKTQINAYKTFEQACEKNDINKLFALTQEHPALRTTDAFKQQIINYQNSILNPALSLAKQGEVIKMQALLAPFLTLEHFKEKHIELFKIALAREIMLYAPYGQEESLLKSYHECFGWDEYYQQACLYLECQPNEMQKLDPVDETCYQISTFIIGEKVKRKPQQKESNNATTKPNERT